jgi:hypothetical protein
MEEGGEGRGGMIRVSEAGGGRQRKARKMGWMGGQRTYAAKRGRSA